jgi:hypothetical protein
LKEAWQRQIGQLARHLWDKAQPFAQVATLPPRSAHVDLHIGDTTPWASNRRTVFLARPANDMRGTYSVLVRELAGRGYTVVPDPEMEIPDEGHAATEYIDLALGKAELSIHLLGDKRGFAPDGAAPIVQLQLMRAAAGALPRLIWAPTVMVEAPNDALQRDPQDVLARLEGVPADRALRQMIS